MLRRILALSLTLALGLSAHGATRWLTDRQGAPVSWRGWGAPAFEEARKSGRPVFLTIGYASSFDCYRMHREAFLNGEIAEHLNTYFIPVVLDRIEYPEIAEAYDTVLRSMGVGPSCPANLILTPALEPIAGAGFLRPDALNRMLVIHANRWAGEKEAMIGEARANLAKARELGEKRMPSEVDAATIEAVVDAMAAKYAETHTLDAMAVPFLLRYAARTNNDRIREIVREALRELATQPVRDQLGGGFHRTEDSLEKLLPDQARLAIAFLEASQVANDPDLAFVARTTLDFVVRDLRVAGRGPFDASQDAHSLVPGQGPVFVNGAFYVWDVDEITRLVGHDSAGKIIQLFGLHEGAKARPALSETRGLHEERDELAEPLAKMLEVRQKRPAPFREGTNVAGWNGLMISALARGAAVLDEQRYLDAATSAAEFVATKLWTAPSKTLRRTHDGVPALAEDYAFVVQGLLDLFESGHDPRWLQLAVTLQQRQDALFWDASAGRYATGGSLPEVLRGLLVERDGIVPATNAVSALNLLRLAALTGHASWRNRPAMIVQSFGGRLRTAGDQLPELAAAYESSRFAPRIVVVAGDFRNPETRDALRRESARWEPMRALVFLPTKGIARQRVLDVLPFTGGLAADPEHPVVYVCAGGECAR